MMKEDKPTFKAYRIEAEDDKYVGRIKQVEFKPLYEEEIRVKVFYSSLNYKDALSATGNKGVTKVYPHTPGIDAVGLVEESKSELIRVGAKVIVTSYDLGMNTDGGFATYITVPAAWAIGLPNDLSPKEAMAYGTAGLTAGMSVMRLSELVKPADGKVVVTGATGGVGALSVSILSKLGYDVVAITGKATEHDFLFKLGAKEVMTRSEMEDLKKQPLLKPLFAGAIDTVGGVILENIIKTTQPMGAITCCGNVASPKLDLTVFPFILRGITLIGIDSQNFAMEYRCRVWEKLANAWKPKQLLETCTEITVEEVQTKLDLMLLGRLKGRTILNLRD